MTKIKRTVHVHIWYENPPAASTDEVIDALKSVLCDLQAECHAEVSRTLEDLGAKNVEMSMMVY